MKEPQSPACCTCLLFLTFSPFVHEPLLSVWVSAFGPCDDWLGRCCQGRSVPWVASLSYSIPSSPALLPPCHVSPHLPLSSPSISGTVPTSIQFAHIYSCFLSYLSPSSAVSSFLSQQNFSWKLSLAAVFVSLLHILFSPFQLSFYLYQFQPLLLPKTLSNFHIPQSNPGIFLIHISASHQHFYPLMSL